MRRVGGWIAESASLSAGTEAPAPRIVLAFDESQQVGVDRLGLGRDHAVGKVFVGFHSAMLQELRRQRSGGDIRDDLVVLAVHDQHRHIDLLQILGEIGLREGDNAVAMRLGPPIIPCRHQFQIVGSKLFTPGRLKP
jgi:hypothetical protein